MKIPGISEQTMIPIGFAICILGATVIWTSRVSVIEANATAQRVGCELMSKALSDRQDRQAVFMQSLQNDVKEILAKLNRIEGKMDARRN